MMRLVAFCALLLLSSPHCSANNSLADYMRATPKPTSAAPEETAAPSTSPTTVAPTESPSVAPTSEAPTELPTVAPSTVAPTEAEGKDADLDLTLNGVPQQEPAPTMEQTQEEKPIDDQQLQDIPTAAPSYVPAPDATTATSLPPPPPTVTQAESLYDDTLDFDNSFGEVFVDFSLFSPNVTNRQMNFMKLKMSITSSIDVLICDETSPIANHDGGDYCAVRDTVLAKAATTASRRDPQLFAQIPKTTVLALSTTNVRDATAVTYSGKLFSWTTWKLGWDIVQIGETLREHVTERYGSDLTEEEQDEKAHSILQHMMSTEFEGILRDGVFEHDLNLFMNPIVVMTSVVGEEVATFGMAAHHSTTTSAKGEELAGEDEEGTDLMIIFFFAGLGAACFVIVILLYFSFRSRDSQVSRKRTIIIVDDTSKSCTDSQGDSTQENSNKVMVFDADHLRQDPPRQQDEEWGEADVDVDDVDYEEPLNDNEEEEEEEEQDNQTARSMAHSTAYTGSISAITGVSGLEGSDTWSVGSMSIDLAEWG
ncbi:expressed unknown protein [Seminavis robusta]|uniref:Uncharacterized protein n=1 Tax=Seminavis robusta TaxID=568900 RepID=A0A9N8EZK6_9STRA|nr:expressed unknown protein [Seminavis robusta]|eukprot:Sro2435_g327570.1 n/a (538) ;mRNA; f:8998-10611